MKKWQVSFCWDSKHDVIEFDVVVAESPRDVMQKLFSSTWECIEITDNGVHHYRMKDARVTVYIYEKLV